MAEVMTDRELLELAAKAVGYGIEWSASSNRFELFCDGKYKGRFDPLADDGAALRLAVSLGVTIAIDLEGGCTRILNEFGEVELRSMHECTDPLQATRRAVVRYAAGVGNRMQCKA